MVLLRHLLGDALRRLRLRQGRTLREVSAAARVSLGYLSEVERGQKEASSELLSSICSALGTPLSQVLREVSDNFALAELQNEPVLTGAREPQHASGPPAGPARQAVPEPGPAASAASHVRLGAPGGRQLAMRERPAMVSPAIGSPALGGSAPGRLQARAGQRLGTPRVPAIDAASLQGGGPFDQLNWGAPDLTDMVPV
jgi:transcriptional regulator with XRE-family HTH domain